MRTTVYKNASIVTGLSVAERGLGFLYRIVLSRLIGAEGLGLYQVALSLFGLFLTVGTGGVPITVSRMITKSKAQGNALEEKKSVTAGFYACLLLSLPVCLFLWIFGEKLPFLFADGRAFAVLKILLIGLCFSCLYAVVRGYFWGNKEFLTPSLIEIVEETVMVIVGVLLLKNIPSPLVGAKRAAWAATVSYLFSFAVATLCFFLQGGKLARPKNSLKPLFNAAMPITSVRASGSLVTSAVAVILPVMLMRAGASESDALRLFGIVTGMVFPVLFMPSTLIGSLALVLVPELSEDCYRKNHLRLKKNILRGLRFSLFVAFALIPFFLVLGDSLGRLAFANATAGEMLRHSCFLLIPMSLTMISTSILNAMGFEKNTFVFFFVGAAALLLAIFFLPAVCGAYAYIVGLGASYIVTAACNLIFLYKKCPFLKNTRQQVRDQRPFYALLGIFPITLVGIIFRTFLARFLGQTFLFCATAAILALPTFALYLFLYLSPRKKSVFSTKKFRFAP